MGFLTERQQLVTLIEDCFSDESITRVYENRALDPTSISEWIRINIHSNESSQISLGNCEEFRYEGLLSITIFTLPNTGENRPLDLVDRLQEYFRAKRFENIVFKTGTVDRKEEVDGWYQVNYSIPFTRDE